MEELDNMLPRLNVPTHELKLELIQEVMIKAKEHYRAPNRNLKFWNQVSQILWVHIQKGLQKFDDQLLCATCFYTALILTDNQELYMTKVLELIKAEILSREQTAATSNINQVISLMYGMFQSSFLMQTIEGHIVVIVLENSFRLLILMGHEYTQYTFIAFKTIKSFKKICGTYLECIIFNESNQVTMLNLVNHNWENPITGVRDLIKDIFQTLIKTVNNAMYRSIIKEINSFYWNKAKYLMLAEIIECYKKNMLEFVIENNWLEGLMYSLHKPGLVSAGTDMYFSILKNIKSEDEWCKMFLDNVINILSGVSTKAIENFNNYWCLSTLKKFPNFMNIFIDNLSIMDDSENILYSILFIMKQGNKLGILNRNWSETTNCNVNKKTIILVGLEHKVAQLRMLAFDIICVFQGKTMSGRFEYELILKYLNNNMNSDCTVLRLAMLGSMNYYLTQLHISFLNDMKTSQNLDTKDLLSFCKSLQELLVCSLSLNGNYQRKITCIKLINLVTNCLSELPKKRKGQTRDINKTLVGFLKDQGYWILSDRNFILKLLSLLKDPADDIRTVVVKLLLNYYYTELREKTQINKLINDAFTSMKSKFFYEISCGQSILKLIVNLLLKGNHTESTFQSVEDIFHFGYQQLMTEYKSKRDVMKSIENGTQLHSFISILLEVLEVCIQNSYKLKAIDDIMGNLLEALEEISNQFSWEQTSTSSDFAEMNDMVQEMITSSGYNPYNQNDNSKISGLHQIVLNCLWLNVKACCDLASLLIQYNTEDLVTCEKCLHLITHVLETSRHKGAIESAGAALGRAIQHLTSLPKDSSVSELPYIVLEAKLNQLICEASKMASITRRGAGLSIMVHRIVSSDTRKGKRLFHYFMSTLLETCEKTKDIPNINDDNMENEMDLPKAIYIHFLTRIVTDSSLASDMMYYSAELAELAFNNLTSPHWQIRNAALQLYGALVPRLIGQNKASGTNDETIVTVGCDELRTHSPKLWKYITEQLKNNQDIDIVQCHSNFVPILNMLANSAKRYNFSHDMMMQRTSDEELLASLMSLLSSPIYSVRRLTAKCIFNIYSFEVIYDVLINQTRVSENSLHGNLLLLGYCHKYYSANIYEQCYIDIRAKFGNILNNKSHAYLCKESYEGLFYKNEFNISDINNTLLETDNNLNAPGVFLWADTRLRIYVQNSSWNEISQLLLIILQRNDYEKYLEFINLKIETEESVPEVVLLEIVNILKSFEKIYTSSISWKILYQLSLQIDLSDHVDVNSIIQKLEETGFVSYKLRYVIPFTAKIVAKAGEQNQIKLSRIIYNLTDPENSDMDMRYIAALAINEISYVFRKLSDGSKLNCIKSAIILLQDEDEDVRNLCVEFHRNLSNLTAAVHPYICLHNILEITFLKTVFDEPQRAIEILCNDLSNQLFLTSNCIVDEYNPFANDTKNIYVEIEIIKLLIKNVMIHLY